jgi:hypothetical protein
MFGTAELLNARLRAQLEDEKAKLNKLMAESKFPASSPWAMTQEMAPKTVPRDLS